jgi:hypothetical protein
MKGMKIHEGCVTRNESTALWSVAFMDLHALHGATPQNVNTTLTLSTAPFARAV